MSRGAMVAAAPPTKKKKKPGRSGKNLIKKCEYCQNDMRSDYLTKHIATVHRN